MPLAHAKSFVAGLLLLAYMVRSLFVALPLRHTNTLHKYNLVACSVLAALCLWHAFQGKKPILGKSEFSTSLILGACSLIVGLGLTMAPILAWSLYRQHGPSAIVLGVLYLTASAYYFRSATRELKSEPKPEQKSESTILKLTG